MSLLEALGATALLSAALLGLANGSITLTRNLKTADAVSAANALAQQKLEELRSMPLGAAQLNTGSYTDPGNPLKADGTAGFAAGIYTRTWTLSPRDTPSFGLKTVTVTVSWRDSQPHTTQLAAYVRCSTIPCP